VCSSDLATKAKIVFVGAGNLATHLATALQQAGHVVAQVYSRTPEHAQALAERLQTAWITNLNKVVSGADVYFFAVRDDALPTVVAQIQPNDALWVHTAGSHPLDVFDRYTQRCGVLYPLQTFSVGREVDFSRIPCFIEARRPDDARLLCNLASSISADVQMLNAEQRKYLHLAAVFACNFTNHMYRMAWQLLEQHAIPPQTLWPLIDETAAKVHALTPAQAQTGPAVRLDRKLMDMQAGLLDDADAKTLYQLISNHIHLSAYEQYPFRPD
jgi:predicted short-subunit dehydrogenase-like oxidoreductase (DUF2520 family)